MTRLEAEEILRHFIYTDDVPVGLDYETIRSALHCVVELSDSHIFGVCAENTAEAIAALQSYLSALNYDAVSTVQGVQDGLVYVKYNPQKGYAVVSPYVGDHRGVLVSCQSPYDDRINETFGHLPLDLFGKE